MLFSQLEEIATGKILQLPLDRKISNLITDSRKPIISTESVFFAFAGHRHDGHQYITQLYTSGIRQFIIERKVETEKFPEANFFQTESTLKALQDIAALHRKHFTIPVVGITGSNGKTIVKEWLFQLLEPDFNIVRSPKSYNSQLGVPLSVWT